MTAPSRVDERLDRYLVRTGIAGSRRSARDLIAQGEVLLNGQRCRKSAIVGQHDHVEVAAHPTTCAIVPDGEVTVLYEGRNVLVVDKPPLMPCHPIRAGETGTVINAAVARYPEVAAAGNNPLEGGLVHRLDNGTSGALMIARDAATLTMMRADIRDGRTSRIYEALIVGTLMAPIEIARPIAHSPKNRRKMVALNPDSSGGRMLASVARAAATVIEPLEQVGGFTHVTVKPRTGRRHQIRVHMASEGFPLAGDQLYGGPPLEGLAEGRFWLHLAELEFITPQNERVRVSAPLASDLRAVLKRLRLKPDTSATM
ncbi:MAG: RluA family pseudouridine synthase [Candidatus Binataceae bacterium]